MRLQENFRVISYPGSHHKLTKVKLMIVSQGAPRLYTPHLANRMNKVNLLPTNQEQCPDKVTLSDKGNATAGLVTMISGLLIGGAIASAVPVLGVAVCLGSIFAGLAMAT